MIFRAEMMTTAEGTRTAEGAPRPERMRRNSNRSQSQTSGQTS